MIISGSMRNCSSQRFHFFSLFLRERKLITNTRAQIVERESIFFEEISRVEKEEDDGRVLLVYCVDGWSASDGAPNSGIVFRFLDVIFLFFCGMRGIWRIELWLIIGSSLRQGVTVSCMVPRLLLLLGSILMSTSPTVA
jgi:hypothetical protein